MTPSSIQESHITLHHSTSNRIPTNGRKQPVNDSKTPHPSIKRPHVSMNLQVQDISEIELLEPLSALHTQDSSSTPIILEANKSLTSIYNLVWPLLITITVAVLLLWAFIHSFLNLLQKIIQVQKTISITNAQRITKDFEAQRTSDF